MRILSKQKNVLPMNRYGFPLQGSLLGPGKVYNYFWRQYQPAHTNNEINSEKNHETYTCFSAVVGGNTS